MNEARQPPDIPREIGKYRIVRLLGVGGMGAVYEATQENPQRSVALKVMAHGLVTEETRKRFEYEAQVLARLQHPGIAQIYEAATYENSGVTLPYFAMELVQGAQPITKYADSQGLSVHQRIELFDRVCEAVHHGHVQGVLHRDLKPDNVLVDAEGRVKIIDFGVARSTDTDLNATTMLTEEGQLVGTLAYMSPEQVVGERQGIDLRSDVYSLGVVLYELLTSRLPYEFQQAALFEAMRMIQETSPTRPSTLVRLVRGDIEVILLKALEKDRERRYRSVESLGSDLRCYLDGRPITARAPSLAYRSRMFVRRYRALVAATALVILALSAGVAVSTVQYFRADEARERAVHAKNQEMEARQREAEQRRVAQSNAELAQANADEAQRNAAQAQENAELARVRQTEAERQARIATAVSDFLNKDVIGSADMTQSGRRDITLIEALDLASPGIEERFADDPDVAANLHFTLGQAYMGLTAVRKAAFHLRRAKELQPLTEDGQSGEQVAYASVAVLLKLAKARSDSTIPELRDLLHLSNEVLGEEHEATLNLEVALGTALFRDRRFGEAQVVLEQVVSRLDGGDQEQEMIRMTAEGFLAVIYRETDQPEKAVGKLEELFKEAVREFGMEHMATFTAVTELSWSYHQAGNSQKGLDLAEPFVPVSRRVLGEDHLITTRMTNNVAQMHRALGNVTGAIAMMKRDLESSIRAMGRKHPETVTTMSNLGRALYEDGQLDEAELMLSEAAELVRELLLPIDPLRGITLHIYGDCLLALGWYEEARDVLLESYGLLSVVLAPSHGEIASLHQSLVQVFEELGDQEQARHWRDISLKDNPLNLLR